jgi:hypothetical protein
MQSRSVLVVLRTPSPTQPPASDINSLTATDANHHCFLVEWLMMEVIFIFYFLPIAMTRTRSNELAFKAFVHFFSLSLSRV